MKKKLYSFLIAAFLATTSVFAAADIETGLKLHYTFDQVDTVKTAQDTVPYILDQTANHLDGKVEGALALGAGYANIGKAMVLTDTAKRVRVPATALFDGVKDFTIAFWINQNALVQWSRIFDFGKSRSNYMFLTTDQDLLRFEMNADYDTFDGSTNPLIATMKLPLKEWNHVAIVGHYTSITEGSDTTATITMYINGMVAGVSTNIKLAPYMLRDCNYARFGASQYADPSPNSSIDDFRFYNRALSTEDLVGLNHFTPEFIAAYNTLDIPIADRTDIKEGVDLTLPTTIGGFNVVWTTSDSTVVSKTGVVKHDEIATNDATLTARIFAADGLPTLTKSFLATSYPWGTPVEQLVQYSFLSSNIITRNDSVIIKSEGDVTTLEATPVGGSQILPIGDMTGNEGDDWFNVYVSGNTGTATTTLAGKQWLDLGMPIGTYIYKLRDHTASIFFRRDTTIDHKTWSDYGQLLYAFGNNDNLGTNAYGAMYFEPKRARVSIVSGNYNQEKAGYYIEGGEPSTTAVHYPTPLGNTWHNVTYTQTYGVGYLLFDGVQVVTGPMAAPKEELRKNSNVATRTGTWYNRLGGALYNDNITANNTMLYGFRMYTFGMPTGDINDFFKITGTIQNLNTAIANTTYDFTSYMALLPLLKDARATLAIGYHQDVETALQAAYTTALADSAHKTATTTSVANLTSAIKQYKEQSADWVKMGPILKSFDDERALAYPGLPALETAIATVQSAYNTFEIETQMFADLDTAVLYYMKSQIATATNPADYTWVMTNPGFETGLTGGTKLAGSSSNGTFNIPKGWNALVNATNWVGAQYYTTLPSEGAKCIEVWTGAVLTECDYSQNVPLEKGWYVLSGDIRGGSNTSNGTQHIYAVPELQKDGTGYRIKSDTLSTNGWVSYSWNQLAWKKVFAKFYSPGGTAKVGFHANNAVIQFDNMKLAYFGLSEPTVGDVTASIKNPGFESGARTIEKDGFDANTAAKAELGDLFAPNDWKILANVDTTANNANFNILTSGATEGSKAYRMSADTLKNVKLYQNLFAPSSGIYKLSVDVRTDSAYNSDARLFAQVNNRSEEGMKLMTAVDSLRGKSFQGWKTLNYTFRAAVKEPIQLGVMSSKNVDVDNFKLELSTVSLVGIKGTNAVNSNKYKVYTKDGVINISGLTNERVSVYDIAGRQISVKNPSQIKVSKGMYLIKINNEVIKQLVK